MDRIHVHCSRRGERERERKRRDGKKRGEMGKRERERGGQYHRGRGEVHGHTCIHVHVGPTCRKGKKNRAQERSRQKQRMD